MVARQIVAWARAQDLDIGRVRRLDLPNELKHASVNGTVHVGRLDEDNFCILLIDKIGFKGNFEGLYYCTRRFNPGEIVRSEQAEAAYISLPGFEVFEELYVKRIHDDQTATIYFNLN